MRHCLRGVTHRKEARSMKRNLRVKTMILDTIKIQRGLFAAILFAVTGAIISALLPPLVLARIIDGIAAGDEVSASFLLLYFLLLALTGFLEAAREGLLTVFGQKMTHALRSSLMEKFGRLTSDNVNRQEPGMLVSRFVGDVDTVENLFTSGIVSMFADACKIISILAVIWFRNRGLTFVLLVLLPFLFWFTRHVQKNMLSAQIENRRAVGRASGHVPETLHNIPVPLTSQLQSGLPLPYQIRWMLHKDLHLHRWYGQIRLRGYLHPVHPLIRNPSRQYLLRKEEDNPHRPE